MKIFDKNLALVAKSMDLRARRNELSAANIANRETPGYLAKDTVFEKELYKAFHSEKPGPLKTSHPQHFDGAARIPMESVTGNIIHSFNPDPRKDGNTVNLDKEMAKLAENQVQFDASVKIMRYKLAQLKHAVREGG